MRLPKFIRRLWMPLFAVLILGLIATIQIREPFVVAATNASRGATGGAGSMPGGAARTGGATGAAGGAAAPRYGPCPAPYSKYDGTTRCQTPNVMAAGAPCPAGPNGTIGTRHSSGRCGISRPRA
jgi:hypothetical protein